jgi:uncharacterized protein YggE
MIGLVSRKVRSRILVLTAALVAATPLAVRAADMPPPTISVTGEATISAPPDLAEVDGGVTTQAKTAREASDANNKAMAAVLAALKSAGIAEADIRTSRLSLQPQMAPTRANSDTPPVIVGYRASNRVTIRVHDMGRVANTIDTLLAAGANDIGGVNFMVSNASKWLDEARPKAIADARRKAEIYAKAAGVTIGAPLSISEGSSSGPIAPRMFRASPVQAAPTPIAAGDETLTITISISYEIKPATP